MKFTTAIGAYLDDMKAEGRINSHRTELLYDSVLRAHAQDVGNRDPRTTGRDDVKRTLRRWPNPNTMRLRRSILISFYRWTVEEGMRPYNPAEQTRRPRARKTTRYRLTAQEAGQLLAAGETQRERWALHLGLIAGLRSEELRGLRGHHFQRDGLIHVSADIAKGGRERWIPVLPQLQDVVGEIRLDIADQEYVLCAIRWRDPGHNTQVRNLRHKPLSAKGLWALVKDCAARAGLPEEVSPHTMRHAFADHIARYADGGERTAQQLLGHASIATTEIYLGSPTLDQIQAAVATVPGYPLTEHPKNPMKATTGIEPVLAADHDDDQSRREQEATP